MNKEESLALLAQGRDAWNAWAAEMLKAREAMRAAGTWTASSNDAEWNEVTQAWHAAAEANFRGHQFNHRHDFSGFVFPGRAEFTRAKFTGAKFTDAMFSGDAEFSGATFSGDAMFHLAAFSGAAMFNEATFSSDVWFHRVTFSGTVWFCKATFSGDAWFIKATFSDRALFGEATFSDKAIFGGATFSDKAVFGDTTFSGDASFLQSVFGGFTKFADTRFEEEADFRAIDGKSAFSLSSATFLAVPDFIQAHFSEAPQLDNSRIQPRRFRWPTLADIKDHFKGDRDLPALWRALKRLAVQGHDHMYELEFFKNEMKARRWVTDRPWHAVFWFGLFYGWLSDFGRSIVRPLFWWVGSAYVFALLYLDAAKASALLDCFVGRGDPWRAALWVSARKALLFFGLDSSDKLTQHYACLYGVITSRQLPVGIHLDVPDSVIVLGIAQHIISAVLLFLLLLAIRNHFRIK